MPWQPKATAPDYFSLADAFLALITGDPDWGWLVDWLTLMPNTGVETAAFCAEGPIFAAQLVVTDFIPSFNPLDPRRGIQTAALMARIAAAARDRVFAAYCELPTAGSPTTYGAETCFSVVAANRGGGSVDYMTIPAGATKIRVRRNSWSGGTGGTRELRVTTWDPTNQTIVTSFNGTESGGALQGDFNLHAGNTTVQAYPYGTADYTGEFCVSFNNQATLTPHTPTEQLQPDGVTSPLRTVEPTLEGIALELEQLEWKLDILWPLVQSVAGATLDLGGPLDDAVDITPDTPLAITDAVGVVITASGVPEEMSIGFGVPQEVARLGLINFGSATAWFPSIRLTHVPMIIRPLPPGTTRITVSGIPPGITVTIAPILPLK
jgi:hypothetical protein